MKNAGGYRLHYTIRRVINYALYRIVHRRHGRALAAQSPLLSHLNYSNAARREPQR